MVTSGAITNRIDRLVARGLVTREIDPDNRRALIIGLTDEGWTLIDRVVTDHVAYEQQMLECLDTTQRGELASLLRTLLVCLDDAPPQSMRAGTARTASTEAHRPRGSTT